MPAFSAVVPLTLLNPKGPAPGLLLPLFFDYCKNGFEIVESPGSLSFPGVDPESRRRNGNATFKDHQVGRINPDSDDGAAISLEDEEIKKNGMNYPEARATPVRTCPNDCERPRELPRKRWNTGCMDGWIPYFNGVENMRV